MFVPPRRSLLILALALLAGCGTVTATVKDGPSIYGGVRRASHNCEWAHDPAEGIFWLCDIPFSAVVDTAMLPVTIPISASRDSTTTTHDPSGGCEKLRRRTPASTPAPVESATTAVPTSRACDRFRFSVANEAASSTELKPTSAAVVREN